MDILSQHFAILATLLLTALASPLSSAAEERYFLNDQEALLYKVINWWYHADPDEAAGVCGTVVRVAADSPPTISHDPTNKKAVHTFSNFAHLVSAGKSPLLGMGMENKGFFRVEMSESRTGNRLLVSVAADTETTPAAEELYPELEGAILGLRDGKVAFYTADDNLFNCPTRPKAPPVRLRIFRKGHLEPSATFVFSAEEQ